MPLNVPKNYTYQPTQTGPVQILTRSSTRAKLAISGIVFRAKDLGLSGNLIKVSLVQEGELYYFIQQNTNLSPKDQIIGDASLIELYTLDLQDKEHIVIKRIDTVLSVVLVKNNTEVLLGKCIQGKLFSSAHVNFKLIGEITTQELKLVPRIHTSLVAASETTSPETNASVLVLDIESLRASLKEDAASYVSINYLPPVAEPNPLEKPPALGPFEPEFLTGGSGLPPGPMGMNQGPERTLIFLNYGELETSEMGVLNEMYEWVGSSSTQGEWKRYS